MIAAAVGKKFLRAFNEKYGTTYDAQSFFRERYFPLFFDHNKYMQWITNSPFVQGIKKGAPPTATERKKKLESLIEKVSGTRADASIAIGYPSLDTTATTSGQLTDLVLPLNQEDVYYSWIGSGLGIGVQGGLSILFDKAALLLDLFEGWEIYRQYLNTMPALRGNQINTWNGQWLAHRYDPLSYIPDDPTAWAHEPYDNTKEGGQEMRTQSWISIMVGVSRRFPDEQITGYVYNLGQTNITIGFIPFRLPQIRRPVDLYQKYFGLPNGMQVEQLFGTAYGFTRACQLGAIGIQALEPKGLREFIQTGKIPSYQKDNEEKTIHFNTYQIWLLAMLNNEQLWQQAADLAATLNQYALSSSKGKKDKSNQVKTILEATNRKQFIDSLTVVVEDAPDKEAYTEIARTIHMMPLDNVPYFLTLVRFRFAAITR